VSDGPGAAKVETGAANGVELDETVAEESWQAVSSATDRQATTTHPVRTARIVFSPRCPGPPVPASRYLPGAENIADLNKGLVGAPDAITPTSLLTGSATCAAFLPKVEGSTFRRAHHAGVRRPRNGSGFSRAALDHVGRAGRRPGVQRDEQTGERRGRYWSARAMVTVSAALCRENSLDFGALCTSSS
jgi:hypothetical protein